MIDLYMGSQGVKKKGSASALPTRSGLIVKFFGLDPFAAAAIRPMLFLPERRTGLEIIHQKLRRFKRGQPMG
jgi:hypothetical protein